MKTLMVATLGVLVAGSAVAAPLDLAAIGADAKWVFHFDWEQYKTTDMYQFIKTMPARQKAATKMAQATELLGFNPLEDIDSMTAYGASFKRGDGAMIVRGSFDPQKAIGLMQKSSSYATEVYGAYTIHTWEAKHHRRRKKGACAFYDGGTAVLSKTPGAVKAAIDVLNANAPSLPANTDGIVVPALARDVFAMAYAGKVEMGQHPKAAIFKNMDSFTLAAAETDGTMVVEASMDASSTDQATLIQNAVSGMLSFGMLRAADKPAMAEMMTAMKVDSKGEVVTVSFAKKSDELLAVMMEQVENRCRRWKSRHGKKQGSTDQ